MVRGAVQKEPSPEEQAAFDPENPDVLFTDLEEIGHGGFGAVYQARNSRTGNLVALKKMSLTKGFASDEWGDIYKEIQFLKIVKHENITQFHGAYRNQLTVYLSIELCFGSVCDIMDVFRAPFAEAEIGEICKYVLKALSYLHGLNRIHRDIKGGNVLITEHGKIKLGDLGSASVTCPANSFVGSPYWMSPEVIMAMESGTYDGRVDIWSLGITAIELAERKPPLFEMNAMSALYHIPQNPPPSLSQPDKWGNEFQRFIERCLVKEPESRPVADVLLSDPFMVASRPANLLESLVFRTKTHDQTEPERTTTTLASLMDAFTPQKQMSDTPSETHSDDGSRSPQPSTSSALDSEPETPSSLLEVPSRPAGHSRQPSDAPTVAPLIQHRNETAIQKVRSMRRATRVNLADQNEIISAQLKEIKKLRHDQNKELKALQVRHDAELIQITGQETKENEQLSKQLERDFDKLMVRQQAEMDAFNKQDAQEEKKYMRTTKDRNSVMLHDFQEKERRQSRVVKDEYKAELETLQIPKDEKLRRKQDYKEKAASQMLRLEQDFVARQAMDEKLGHMTFKMNRLPMRQALEKQQLDEELRYHTNASNQIIAFKQKYRTILRTTLKSHTDERANMQLAHLNKVFTVETSQAELLERAEFKEIQKRHLADLKRQPKELKATEARIKKMFQDTVKIQTRQYKSLSKSISESVPKAEQEEVMKKNKEEQTVRLAKLEEQYRASLAEVVDRTAEKLHAQHKEEMDKHNQTHEVNMLQLKTYQNSRLKNLQDKHKDELLRYNAHQAAVLEDLQKFESSEAARLAKEHERVDRLAEKHKQESDRLQEQFKKLQAEAESLFKKPPS